MLYKCVSAFFTDINVNMVCVCVCSHTSQTVFIFIAEDDFELVIILSYLPSPGVPTMHYHIQFIEEFYSNNYIECTKRTVETMMI